MDNAIRTDVVSSILHPQGRRLHHVRDDSRATAVPRGDSRGRAAAHIPHPRNPLGAVLAGHRDAAGV